MRRHVSDSPVCATVKMNGVVCGRMTRRDWPSKREERRVRLALSDVIEAGIKVWELSAAVEPPKIIIGAMVHQPVLRLAIGINEPLRRYLGGERRPYHRHCAAREQRSADPARPMFAILGLTPALLKVTLPMVTVQRASSC